MRRLPIYTILLIEIFFSANVLSQENLAGIPVESSFKWKKISKEDLKNRISNANPDRAYHDSYRHFEKNKEVFPGEYLTHHRTDIRETSWEKMPGPFGGTVRKITEYYGVLYILTDREVFKFIHGKWVGLGFDSKSINSIRDIHVFENRNILIIGDGNVFEYKDNENKWVQKYIDSGNSQLNVHDLLFFPERDSLLLATSDGIYSTDNFGISFRKRSLSGSELYSISIDSDNFLWAVSSEEAVKSELEINEWETVIETDFYYWHVFSDKNYTTYLYSFNGLIKTTDGGDTWWELTGSGFSDISVGLNGGVLIAVSDIIIFSGIDDEVELSTSAPQLVLTSYLLNEEEILVGTLGSGIFSYNISEGTFQSFSQGMNISTIRAIEELKNGDIVISTDSDSLYISKDNGYTWKSVAPFWTMNIVSTTLDEIFLTVFPGKLYKSSDHGETWDELKVGERNWVTSFDASKDGASVYATDDIGRIFRSSDQGSSFELVNEGTGKPVPVIKALDKSSFILQSGGVYYSNNYGVRLDSVTGVLPATINDIERDNQGHIYIATYSGIYRSFNGLNWNLVSNENFGMQYLDIDQKSNIYGTRRNGLVYISQDYAKTWELISELIPNTFVWSFMVSKTGILFYGTQDKGLYTFKYSPDIIQVTEEIATNNFPNPFSGITRIEYTLTEPSNVKILIYNILGNLITVLEDSFKEKGRQYVDWSPPADTPSGVYLYTLETDRNFYKGRMVYIKK